MLTFRGSVLRSCDIPLARAIAVSPWLGGPGCALPCFGFIGFRCFFVYCRMSGYWSSDCFGNGFRGVWGSIRSGRAHKLPTPRAGAKNNVRGELDKGIAFEDMKEEKFPRNGWMGIFEVWHGRVSSRGVLETGRGLWKTEKVGESDGWTGIKGVYSCIRDKQLLRVAR